MSIIDIILISVLIFSFIYGLFIGFISVLFPLTSLAISILATPKIKVLLLNNFDFYKESPLFNIITYIAVYIVIRIIFGIFEKPIKKALKSLSLGFIEKLFGGVALIIISSLIIVLLFYTVLSFMKKDLSFVSSDILNILFYYLDTITKFIHL